MQNGLLDHNHMIQNPMHFCYLYHLGKSIVWNRRASIITVRWSIWIPTFWLEPEYLVGPLSQGRILCSPLLPLLAGGLLQTWISWDSQDDHTYIFPSVDSAHRFQIDLPTMSPCSGGPQAAQAALAPNPSSGWMEEPQARGSPRGMQQEDKWQVSCMFSYKGSGQTSSDTKALGEYRVREPFLE